MTTPAAPGKVPGIPAPTRRQFLLMGVAALALPACTGKMTPMIVAPGIVFRNGWVLAESDR